MSHLGATVLLPESGADVNAWASGDGQPLYLAAGADIGVGDDAGAALLALAEENGLERCRRKNS